MLTGAICSKQDDIETWLRPVLFYQVKKLLFDFLFIISFLDITLL